MYKLTLRHPKNLVERIVFGKLSAINGFENSLPVAVCPGIANSFLLGINVNRLKSGSYRVKSGRHNPRLWTFKVVSEPLEDSDKKNHKNHKTITLEISKNVSLLNDVSLSTSVVIDEASYHKDALDKKEEYDIWALEMEHYLKYIDNDVWKERKARTVLLMVIPKEHLRRFHGMDDAKEIWEAIRTRVFEQELISTSKSSASAQNVAFVSHSKSSTNKVKSGHTGAYNTYTPSTSSNNIPEREVPASFADETYQWIAYSKEEDSTRMTEGRVRIEETNLILTKNYEKLVDSGMSSTSKVGLGYEIKSNDEVLSYEEEMNHTVFNCTEEDFIDKPLFSRFSKTDSFKGVPHPLTGDYTPKPQQEIDESLIIPLKNMEDRGYLIEDCTGHMTGSKDHLDDFEECKGGSVTFGGSKGYITGDKYTRFFLLKLNVFVSPDFKMPDENQILIKVLRQHNMYSFDMKTLALTKDYACLIAKATSDKSKLWHMRLGTSEVTNSAGTLQTPNANASEEEDKAEELIVVPTAVRHTASKVRPRKSSTNSKAEEFLTELQNLKTQEKEAYSTGISEDTPEILAFRRELDELAQKHLREVPKNKATSTNSVNSGSGPSMIQQRYNRVAVSPIPTLRIHNIHPQSQILGDPKSSVQTRSRVQQHSGAHALVSYVQKAYKGHNQKDATALFVCLLPYLQEELKKISEALKEDQLEIL
ncbi:hypothetical protein Tco_0682950 [Tanacetum coccineum]|uniref:Uncharacterized protein n=1 Tax=Tanacetum coccineum TaxID=301880 RepID=A0ABQ4XSM5_9ASTR